MASRQQNGKKDRAAVTEMDIKDNERFVVSVVSNHPIHCDCFDCELLSCAKEYNIAHADSTYTLQ